jgi:hypothetical protein
VNSLAERSGKVALLGGMDKAQFQVAFHMERSLAQVKTNYGDSLLNPLIFMKTMPHRDGFSKDIAQSWHLVLGKLYS